MRVTGPGKKGDVSWDLEQQSLNPLSFSARREIRTPKRKRAPWPVTPPRVPLSSQPRPSGALEAWPLGPQAPAHSPRNSGPSSRVGSMAWTPARAARRLKKPRRGQVCVREARPGGRRAGQLQARGPGPRSCAPPPRPRGAGVAAPRGGGRCTRGVGDSPPPGPATGRVRRSSAPTVSQGRPWHWAPVATCALETESFLGNPGRRLRESLILGAPNHCSTEVPPSLSPQDPVRIGRFARAPS